MGADGEQRTDREMYFMVCREEFLSLHTSIEQLRNTMLDKFEGMAKDQTETKMDVRSMKQELKDYNGLRSRLATTEEMAKDAVGYIAAEEKRKEKEEKRVDEKKMHVWKTAATGILVPIVGSIMVVLLALFKFGQMLAAATGK